MLTHALGYLERRGVSSVRLDATELGRPVYERLGFRVDCEQRRYFGSPTKESAAREDGDVTAPLTNEQLVEAGRLDAAVTGNDRTRLLELVHRDWPDSAFGSSEGGALHGFVVCRRGSRAPQLGPCIANNLRHGATLLRTVFARFVGRPVFVDVPTANRAACHVVEEHGLAVERVFSRMTFGREVAVREENVWANYGPELG